MPYEILLQHVSIVPCLCVFGISHFGLYYLYSSTKLNNNREIISKWNKRVGCVVQKKVAENCIRVLKENNLDFKIEDLLSQNVEGFFEKECLFNMKDILRELLM